MCIKSDADKGQQYQKWLFAVSEINKIGIAFISFFLLKARVSYLTMLKRKNLSLPLKDETDQFVTCLVLPECLSVKIAFHPRTVIAWGESWWRRYWVSFSRCFSLFLPLLRTLAQEKRSEIVFVLGLVGGVSISIHYCRKISEYFSPLSQWPLAQSDLLAQSECTLSRFAARLRILNLIGRGSASYVINLHGMV